MIKDIKINNISLSGMGWIRENIDFPTPQSQSETVVVPGRNSPIRFTEALGSVSFQPRAFTISLSMLGTRERFNELVRETSNQFAGRLAKVITSEDPDLYCIGTLEIETSYDPLEGKGELVISCSDADSYRYHVDETNLVVSGNKIVILANDYMPVVPVVVTTADTTLSWKIGTDSFHKTVSEGTWEFPEMELAHGNNSITVKTTGTVTFRYREGCL